MFSIITTQSILEKLYREDSTWGNIVAQTKCFYIKVENDWWEGADDTPLIQLSNSQAEIKNGQDIFNELGEKNKLILIKYNYSLQDF